MKHLGMFSTIGEAWYKIVKEILDEGKYIRIKEKNEEYYEIKGVSFTIYNPNINDNIIKKYGDKDKIKWMQDNFKKQYNVKELKNAKSYGERLYNYEGKKNQIDWIISKLKENDFCRSATITTFEPLTDVSYIPCISLLDFDINNEKLDLYVYARAIDFGNKGYANIISLSEIMNEVSTAINKQNGNLNIIMKSAHIYYSELEKMKEMVAELNT